MLTVNKNWVALPAGNIQNNQKQDSPKLQNLKQDTVSFRSKYVPDAVMTAVKEAEQKNGKTFFKTLRELCEDAENGDLAGKADADAQVLIGESANEAISLLNKIEENSATYHLLQKRAKRLKARVRLNPE